MKEVTPIQLVIYYLSRLGIPVNKLQLDLIETRFIPIIYKVVLAKSNVVPQNKLLPGNGNKQKYDGNETHIAIAKPYWHLFFTDNQIAEYEATGDTHETSQKFRFYEANIAALLDERENEKATNPRLASAIELSQLYSINSTKIITGNGCKWIDSNNNSTQVRLSKKTQAGHNNDSGSFCDFRLGLKIGDCLIMLKDKYKDEILAVGIPQSFATKFNIVSIKKRYEKIASYREKELSEDANYLVRVDTSDDDKSITTPPDGKLPPMRKANGKKGAKYIARPGVGKAVLRARQFKCEYEPKHTTFIARSTGKQYMEPHHLIPVSKQGIFSSNLDIDSNIICLCPTCHSKIHYGKPDEIKEMLEFFLLKRKARLDRILDTEIEKEELFSLYDL